MSSDGAHLFVLQAISDAQAAPGKFVQDEQIAQATNIALANVRDWMLSLMKDGYADLVRTEDGYSASINDKGRRELDLLRPFTDEGKPAPGSRLAPAQRTIVLLAANPKGTEYLRLDEEAREIGRSLERARLRDQFRLAMKWAVTPADLRRALLDYEPEIVHFSGHGSGADGIILEDDQGFVHAVNGDVLSGLFEVFAGKVKCVVLNACYSEVQADALVRHIDYVIGMTQAIGDKSAIEFAVGFYDALGSGQDIEFAFNVGRNAIDLARIPQALTPVLKKKS